jgi:three-Cys-motif partner protein
MPPKRTGPKTATWPLDPHTLAKHDLIRRYLGGWFPILAKYNGRVVFLDGFAGPGVLDDGNPGSPIIAMETLLQHRRP